MFIDTHCHLNDKSFLSDIEEIIEKAKKQGVEKIVIPGADPLELYLAIELAQKYTCVFFATGIHPYDLDKGKFQYSDDIINHPKCIAIGECGLDYFRLPDEHQEEYKKAQKQLFIEQIEFSLRFNKPLILHVRNASSDVCEILKQYPDARGVFHCYNADENLLKFSKNFYYGIGGICTFKNARKIIEVLPKIPKDRILLETDAPYLTPVPFRGERNEPSYIPIIAKKVAEVLGVSLQEIEEISTNNAIKFFGF